MIIMMMMHDTWMIPLDSSCIHAFVCRTFLLFAMAFVATQTRTMDCFGLDQIPNIRMNKVAGIGEYERIHVFVD